MIEAFHLTRDEIDKPLPIKQVLGDRERFWITTLGEPFLLELRVNSNVYDGVVLVYKPVDGSQRYGLVLRPSERHKDRSRYSPAVYVRELTQKQFDDMGPDTKIQILNQHNFTPGKII